MRGQAAAQKKRFLTSEGEIAMFTSMLCDSNADTGGSGTRTAISAGLWKFAGWTQGAPHDVLRTHHVGELPPGQLGIRPA